MEIIYLLLGWLLAIPGQRLMDKISNYYKKQGLERIIFQELKDIKTRLAGVPFLVHTGYGTLNEKQLNWYKHQTNNFKDINPDNTNKKELELLNSNIEKDIQKFLIRLNTSGKKNDPAWSFKKINMHIIDSNLINVELIEDKILKKLLEIKFQINCYNEEIVETKEYVKMTFDSNITDINMQIIREGIKNKNYIISDKAIYIVNKINKII